MQGDDLIPKEKIMPTHMGCTPSPQRPFLTENDEEAKVATT
jgi:hypothetical protein